MRTTIDERQKKIEFNVERDFSDTFGTAFLFIRQNFKKLFLTLIYLVGPFLLLSALLSGIYTQTAFDLQSVINNGNNPFSVLTPMYFLTIIATIISGMVLIGVTYEYMVLYDMHGYAGFGVSDVWKRFKEDIGRVIGVFFGLLLVGIILVICVSIVIALFSLLGVGGGVLIGLFILFGLLILGLPIAFVFTAVYLIAIKERKGFWASLKKARSIIKNNFWITWVIVFLGYLIVGILGFVFNVPLSIATGIFAFNGASAGVGYSILVVILTIISVFGTNLVRTILLIIVGVHFYSLNEQKEGVGLLSQIDEIGQSDKDEDEITI